MSNGFTELLKVASHSQRQCGGKEISPCWGLDVVILGCSLGSRSSHCVYFNCVWGFPPMHNANTHNGNAWKEAILAIEIC